jgi:hypothetical protein
MTRPIRYAALFLIAATGAGAQATSTGGRHAAVILELPASARAQALGGGYAALVDDDAAVFYNAAQLVAPAAPDRSAGLSIQQYFASSTVAALSGAMRLGPGALALGIQVLNYGSEDEIVPDPNFGGQRGMATGGTVSASDMVLSAGYGVTARRVRLGGAAKLVRQRVADLSGGTAALDLGAAADLAMGATVAIAVQNLGGDLTLGGTRGSLPSAIRFGAAMPVLTSGATRVTATAEVGGVRDAGAVPAGGLEATWKARSGVTLAARIGASHTKGSDASPVAFGGGLTARHFALDYAYQGYRSVGDATHRLGIRWWR